MAKTFDNISEASATNYLFLFAQRTLALQDEPPTPPPLNALGLPCKAILMLYRKVKAPAPHKPASEQATTSSAAETLSLELQRRRTPTTTPTPAPTLKASKASSSSSSPLSPWSEEVTRGEETPLRGAEEKPLVVKTFTDKTSPLAKQITEYILDHQDDAAQEDRWRTTMKREMSKSFREQHEEMKKVKEEVQQTVKAEIKEVQQTVKAEIKTEMQSMQIKFDEIAGLIKQQLGEA